MLLTFLAIAGIALLIAGLYLPHTGKDIVAERLAAFNQRPRSLEEIELQQPFTERVLRPFIRQLAEALNRFQQARTKTTKETQVTGMEGIQRKLALAGNPYRWTPADYLGMKAFAALVLGGLLVISVEAGLGFDAAIQRLVDKRDDALATEFARVLAEMRVGRSRRDALKDMVNRTQVPDLNNFVGAILQAEQLGVSVTKVLTVQAEQMRVLRRQRAEEKAAQLQLKLIFPLAIFIFPALCVVIMGPIWPTLAGTNAAGV